MNAHGVGHTRRFSRRVVGKINFLWRHHGPTFLPRSLSQMLRAESRPVRRVAFILKGRTAHPATAHIRVLRTFRMLGKRMPLDARPVSASWLLGGGIAKVDAVLVQRDALPPDATDELIGALRSRRIPLLYEIDDWLWNLPPDHHDHGITEAHAISMQKLARAAAVVTVSTERLANIVNAAGGSGAVTMVPNGLDETLWASALPESFVKAIGEVNGLTGPGQKLLYMGTSSHAEDLKLIFPAVGLLRETFPDLEIIQIGGGSLLPGAREISPPEGEYPDFVRWFRAVCSYMTLAVAPLRDDEFNSAKSDIKTLDYGFGLVPAIYSNVGPYRDSVVHGVTGLLSENDTAAWHATMTTMLTDAELRSTIRQRALAVAHERRLSAQPVAHWQSIISGLLADPAGQRR